MVFNMEKIVQQGILYDFYGELLTPHQRQIYECVVYENMSLSEIATEQGISRQGVHDLVKRCDKILLSYEEKLGLVARFHRIKDQFNSLHNELSRFQKEDDYDRDTFVKEMMIYTDSIMKEL